MKDSLQVLMPSGDVGIKSVGEILKHFDSVINRLRRNELGSIADTLENAGQKILSNISLSDEQKEKLITLLDRIGEESSKKHPDNSFFSRLQSSLAINTKNTTPGTWDAFAAVEAVDSIAQLLTGVALLADVIDCSSMDIGDLDFIELF